MEENQNDNNIEESKLENSVEENQNDNNEEESKSEYRMEENKNDNNIEESQLENSVEENQNDNNDEESKSEDRMEENQNDNNEEESKLEDSVEENQNYNNEEENNSEDSMEENQNDNNEEESTMEDQNAEKENNPNTVSTDDNKEDMNMEEGNAAEEKKFAPSHRSRSRSRSPIKSEPELHYMHYMIVENVPNAFNFYQMKKTIVEGLSPEVDIKPQDLFVLSPAPHVQILRFPSIEYCEKAIECIDGKEVKGVILKASFDSERRYKDFKWKTYGETPNKETATEKTKPKPKKKTINPLRPIKPKGRKPLEYLTDEERFGYSVSFLKNLDIAMLKNRIYVKNLSSDITTELLRNIFSRAGDIVGISINRVEDTAFAKVEFDHPVEAVQAISMYHNKELNGRTLCVRMDIQKRKKNTDGLNGIGPGVGPNGIQLRYFRVYNDIKLMKESYDKEIDTLKNTVNDLKSQLEALQKSLATTKSKSVQNEPTSAFNIGDPATQQNVMQILATLLQNQIAQMYPQMGQFSGARATTDQAGRVAGQPGWGRTTQIANQMGQPIGHMSQATSQLGFMAGPLGLNMGQMGYTAGQASNPTSQSGHTGDQPTGQTKRAKRQINQMNRSTGNMNQGTCQMNQPTGQFNQAIGQINELHGHMNQLSQMNRSVNQTQNTPQWSTRPDMYRSDFNRQAGKKSYDNRHLVKNVPFNKYSDRDRESEMLVFSNLPPSVTEGVLINKMREIGDLRFAEIVGNGKAVVRFYSQSVAARCLDLLHRSQVDGHVIDVNYL